MLFRGNRLAALFVLWVAASACGKSASSNVDGGDTAAKQMSRSALLAATGECAWGIYRAFASAADDLALATAALAGDPSDTRRLGAQESWRRAMEIWQEAELFQFGPAGRGGPGAQDLRYQIYSWPEVSRCFIEQQIVSGGYQLPSFSESLVNVRGLWALEYLLFYGGTDNGCSSTTTINSSGAWGQITAEDLDRRKREYARAAAADLTSRARTLLDAWDPAKGNFVEELRAMGSGRQVYKSPQAAINAITDAFITYTDQVAKDTKLGRLLPTGDSDQPRLDLLESPFARRSKSHLRQNLSGLRKIFVGCGTAGEGVGFDDLLDAVGATDLSGRMRVALDGAFRAHEMIPYETLAEALTKDLATVSSLRTAIKAFTDPLKSEFLTILNLNRPQEVAQDRD